MGGGDNELIIKTLLDATGFEKGSKKLMSAIKGLSSSLKGMFGRVIGAASVFGILSKAVSTFMSQNALLTKQMNAAWTALGNALGPIITEIVNLFTKAVSYLVEFMRLLGLTSKTASEASKAAKGAAGTLNRTLAGFDEINKLNAPSGSGTLQNLDPAKWMEGLADALKRKAWDEAADIIVNKFNELIAIAKSKAEELGRKIGEYLQGAIHIIARLIRDVDWSDIGAAIALFLNGLLDQIDGKDLGTILVGKLVIAIKTLTGFLETLDWGLVADVLSDMLIGALNSLSDAINQADWTKIGEGIKEFFGKLWEKKDEIAEAIGNFLKAVWNAAVDLLCGALGIDKENKDKVSDALSVFGGGIGGVMIFKKLTPLIGLLGKLTGAFGAAAPAAEGAAATIGGFTAALPAAIVGAAALYAVVVTNEQEAQYLGEAFDGLGDSSEDLAQGVNNLQGSLEDAQTNFDNLAMYGGDLTMAQEELDVRTAALNDGYKMLAGSLGITVDELKEQISAAGGDATKIKSLEGALGALDESNEDVASSTAELNSELDNSAEKIDEQEEKTEGFAAAFKGKISEAYEKAKDAVTTKAGEMWEKTKSNFENIKETVKTKMSVVKDSVVNGFTNGINGVSSRLSSLRSIVANALSSIGNSAYTWGRDMLMNFWNGISSFTSNLFSGISGVAQGIRNIIGFSEPKEGPLSDFHTYGPDMMELYAEGINSAKDKVFNAVNSVAEGVADGMGGANLPASSVANGFVTPYSVGGEGAVGYGGDLATQISNAVYDAVTAAMERMQSATGQHVAVLEVNGREFCRATYYDQQTVAREHGVTLITNG